MEVAKLKESVEALETGDGVLIVVLSMTFDREEIAKIPGFAHFEEPVNAQLAAVCIL